MTKKELLSRIEELERRVAELERESLLKPYAPYPFPQPQEPVYPNLFGPTKWVPQFRFGDNTADNANDYWRVWSGG